MTRFIYLPIILLAFSCKTTEKIANKKITFDFATPVYPAVETITPKQSIELTLQNINPYLYDVSLKDSLIVHTIDQPALFGTVFTPKDLKTTPAEAPATNDTANNPKSTEFTLLKDKETSLDDNLQTFVEAYANYENAVRGVLTLSTVSDDISKLLTDCYSTIAQLKSKADGYIMAKIATLTAGSLPIGIQSEIDNKSSIERGKVEQYIKSGEEVKKKLNAILEQADPKMPLSQYKSIEKDIKEKTAVIDDILDNCQKLLKKLTDFDEAKVGKKIEENYNKVMTSRIEKTFIIPTQYRTDEVLLNVKVNKKQEVTCLKEISNFSIPVVTKGGVKIDFSTGVVFNIGRNKFFNQSYRYDSVFRGNKTLADSVKIVRNRNNNVVVPSLGAFFHVYSRFVSSFNIGGLVGASLGTDQRTYMHVGGCLLIGKSDRLIIGGGISMATSKTLDGRYSENQEIPRGQAPTAIPTEDANRIGGFVSITWNLNLIK